jgi:hypothetical protein
MAQAQLEQCVEIFTTNGADPQAQAVLAGIGYPPEKLAEGAALLQAVRQRRAQVKELLAAQKQATAQEMAAHQAARRAARALAKTCRVVFAHDEPLLTVLGLFHVGQPSRAMAELIKRWRQMCDGALALEGAAAAHLAEAGWGRERLQLAQASIEAWAQADMAQHMAISARRGAAAHFGAAVIALQAWYTRASGLIRIALADCDPAMQEHIWVLLGLTKR